MEELEQKRIAKEIPQYHREKMYRNLIRNERVSEYYLRLLVSGIVKKRLLPTEISAIKKRMKRLEDCNRFWLVETYEASRMKVLLRTFLCKDKFCNNCNQMKKLVLQNRFLPYMDKYKDSLYHMVLTVPACNGTNLRKTIQQMTTCFKTLVTYLNGNKKVKGIDLTQYEFQGCLRSLEITYKGDTYHPHFHVAAVLGNGGGIENKYMENEFSNHRKRLFSGFEIIIQRIWWLLINRKRLTADNIVGNNDSFGRYSCIADKFQPEDYQNLFGYMTKMYSEDRSLMTYENFKALYYALNRVRQIQGYGVFYNIKEPNMGEYTESDYEVFENYLVNEEKPVTSYEPISRLTDAQGYMILKEKRRPKIKI